MQKKEIITKTEKVTKQWSKAGISQPALQIWLLKKNEKSKLWFKLPGVRVFLACKSTLPPISIRFS